MDRKRENERLVVMGAPSKVVIRETGSGRQCLLTVRNVVGGEGVTDKGTSRGATRGGGRGAGFAGTGRPGDREIAHIHT